MTAPAHQILTLGLAFAALTSLACGKTKGTATPDGSSSADGAACKGDPIFCAGGGPSGSGISCGGLLTSGTCAAGQWTCPKGMVDERDCTCGEPGLSCANQVCTANGPVCLDAGVDADAGRDGPADGQTCGDAANPYCWQIIQSSDVVICGDSAKAATCVGGAWTCPAGSVEGGLCTCTEFHPPGCGICTSQGWACTDAGADGVGDADVRDGDASADSF